MAVTMTSYGARELSGVKIESGDGKKPKFDRVTSSISFPYSDIDDAIAVAEGLLKGGGVPLARDQLAAAMNQSPTGGGFNTKVSTARNFGVIEAVTGKYVLTELGFEIADPARQREAMAKAFLNVELFRRAYDEFRGKRLPPRPSGLENAFMNFGVSHKQAGTARIVFDRSARKAGFFPNGDEDRLVMPILANQPIMTDADISVGLERLESIPNAALAPRPAAEASGLALHRSILGMLDELPPAKSEWSKQEQADWLDALGTLFQVIYKGGKGSLEVSYKPEPNPFD